MTKTHSLTKDIMVSNDRMFDLIFNTNALIKNSPVNFEIPYENGFKGKE